MQEGDDGEISPKRALWSHEVILSKMLASLCGV